MTVVAAAPSSLPVTGVLSSPEYHRLARALSANPDEQLSRIRVAMLASFTATFLKPFLVVEAARRQFAAAVHFGSFGQFEQEIMDGASELWSFAPDALVIAMRPEDVDLDAIERFHASAGQRFAALADTIVERLTACVQEARRRMTGTIVIANVAPPAYLPMGPLDASLPDSLTYAMAALNARIAAVAAQHPGVVVWDYAGIVRSRGSEGWTDPRLWSVARAAIAPQHQAACAAHLVRTICATIRPPAKCLVLDLDNTLWGGVLGDDGPSGIQLSDDHPGNAYKQLQRAALALMDRGILLAVSSKNNPDIVEQTLRGHPEMVLRWEHFACVKANWRSKSENLREIAAELNIGVDALVLFDDNPVERAEVRAALPAVGIVDVPPEPTRYVIALHECEFFDQGSLQAEDRDRAAMYRRERDRRAHAARVTDPAEFLASLRMEADVGQADAHTIARIAQLIGKTNQFNLTTRRHSQADVAAMAQDPDHIVAWMRLRDQFGDHGLVVVGIVRKRGDVAEIDTFLMSCRVMNRRVEQAFMSVLLDHARALQCTRVVGDYIPSAKNGMVERFYPDLGFLPEGDAVDGGQRYAVDLGASPVRWPDVIQRSGVG